MQENLQDKKKPKGPIKFQVQLNEEQKEAKSIILSSDITVIKGSAGSGKSMLASQVALDMLFKKDVEKVILTRPAVTAGEDIGYLPGDKDEKLAPYISSILDNMNRVYKKEIVEKRIQEGAIEVIPLGFMRGRNLSDCCVVVDEAQNITNSQMELLLGRLCKGSKMIICGDTAQIDLKDKKQSGFNFLLHNFSAVPGFSVVTLKTNHRHPIVEDVLKVYAEHR